MSIYTDLKKAGCEISNHESDLYVPVDDISTEIINRYEFKRTIRQFRSRLDDRMYYDIPFAFDPFWEKRLGKKE